MSSGLADGRFKCRSGIQFVYEGEAQRAATEAFVKKVTSDPVEILRSEAAAVVNAAASEGEAKPLEAAPPAPVEIAAPAAEMPPPVAAEVPPPVSTEAPAIPPVVGQPPVAEAAVPPPVAEAPTDTTAPVEAAAALPAGKQAA
jgi:hypothetical protein